MVIDFLRILLDQRARRKYATERDLEEESDGLGWVGLGQSVARSV